MRETRRERSRGGSTPWAILIALATASADCTTFVEPTTCEAGKTACAGRHDARFCEYRAVSVQGSDCQSVGLEPSKPFCVVASVGCFDTNYAVKDRDCRVLEYERLRDSSHDDCAPGTPMFIHR